MVFLINLRCSGVGQNKRPFTREYVPTRWVCVVVTPEALNFQASLQVSFLGEFFMLIF